MPVRVSGTEGYAEAAAAMLARRISFAEVHRPVLHLMPTRPCRVLDIGAGAGYDAADLAAMGHSVVAVERTAALRVPAMAPHPSPAIEWIDDSLPELRALAAAPRASIWSCSRRSGCTSTRSSGGRRCRTWGRCCGRAA